LEYPARYARVSTIEKGQNPLVQLSELRLYAKQRNWEIVREFTDTVSGKRSKRPGLDALMDLVRKRKVQVVLIIRLSRLGRSLPHLISVVSELEHYGVNLVSVNEAIELESPNGRLLFHPNVSERDWRTYVHKGRHIGRPLTINPTTIVKVHEIKARGASLRMISRALNISRSAAYKIISAHQVTYRP
jgi:DNA invertase Pin-like site-specific DNA recombinase